MKSFLPKTGRKEIILIVSLLITSIWAINAVAQQSKSTQESEISTQSWTRTELYYGAGRLPASGERDIRWEKYINEVVTPRFPEGLTLLEGTGQWRVKEGQTPRRNRTRILILIHEDTPKKSQQVDEIRTIWKEISGQQSVLRVSQPANVSF